MHIIVKNKKSGTDPNRVKKEEFLHKLYLDHSAAPQQLNLDMDEMAAAHQYASKALSMQGVDHLSVEERIELINEMTHAIGASTELAQRQMRSMIQYQKNSKAGAAYFQKKEASMRAMLERKS